MAEQIKMYLQKREKDKIIDAAHLINRNGVQLLNLINQILDLSKVDAGKLSVKKFEPDYTIGTGWYDKDKLQNIRSITLQRSENGKISWKTIGQPQPGRNTTSNQQYEVIDKQPLEMAYYRLLLTEWDGSSTFSPLLFLERTDSSPKETFTLAPNPV